MNTEYEILLRRLGLSATVVDCATGSLRLPLSAVSYPPPWYGYPPALIPLWSEGYIYIGIWKHWFTKRPLSFVKVYVRDGHTIVEIARTPEQFFCYATISAIVTHDGIRPETERFAQATGVINLAEIDAVSINTGDEPHGFMAIRQFQTDTPLASVTEVRRYDGWFPRQDFSTAIPWWEHCCSLEVSDEVQTRWPGTVSIPPWLASRPTPHMFQHFLRTGQYRSAWLTLNSAGWSLSEAQTAISQLATAGEDSAFSTLAAAWLAASDGQNGAY